LSLDTIQKYQRVYEYISDYHRLLYDFYSKHAVSFLVTYYHLNVDETIWDDNKLLGGAYEDFGSLTGVMYDKILLLPVYFMEDVTTAFDGQDIGYVKDGNTSLTIPSTYGFTPYPGDIIKFDQTFLRQTNDIYPLFRIEGVEKSTNTDFTFWKLTAHQYQSRTTANIEQQQLNRVLTFLDYDKKIHLLDDSSYLTRLLVKNETLRATLKDLYDNNSGLYFN